jgi:hypothetical protein
MDHLTGQYFVLRDGTMFELTPVDEKGLHREPPKCLDTSGPGFRHWYDHFMHHCMAHGYYVHPYILFRRDYGGNRGFICDHPRNALHPKGELVPDLPFRLSEYLATCDHAIWTLLSKDKMFPEKSNFGTLVRRTFGAGYAAIRLMIMQTSPLFHEAPGTLILNPPRQVMGKTLTEYWVVAFRDYLDMCALI